LGHLAVARAAPAIGSEHAKSPLETLQVYQAIKLSTNINSQKVEDLRESQRISLPIPDGVHINGARDNDGRMKIKAEVKKYLKSIGCEIVSRRREKASIVYFRDQGVVKGMLISAAKNSSHVGKALRDDELRGQPYVLSAVLSVDGRNINIVKMSIDRAGPPDSLPSESKKYSGSQGGASNDPHQAITDGAVLASTSYVPGAAAAALIAKMPALAIGSGTQPRTKVDIQEPSHAAKRIRKQIDFGLAFLNKNKNPEKLLDANWLQDNLHIVINEASSPSSFLDAAKQRGENLPHFGQLTAQVVAAGITEGVTALLDQERDSGKKTKAEQLAQILGETSTLEALVRARGVKAVQPLVRAICIEVPKILKAAGGPDLSVKNVTMKLSNGKFIETSLADALRREPVYGRFGPDSGVVPTTNARASLRKIEAVCSTLMEKAMRGEQHAAEDRQRMAEQRLVDEKKKEQCRAESRRHLATLVAGNTIAWQMSRAKRKHEAFERDSRLSRDTHERVGRFKADRSARGHALSLGITTAVAQITASSAIAKRTRALAASSYNQRHDMLAQASGYSMPTLSYGVSPSLCDASPLPMVAPTAMPGARQEGQTIYVPAIRVDDLGGRYPGEFQAKPRPGAPWPTVILPPPPPPAAFTPGPAGGSITAKAQLSEWKPSEVTQEGGYTAVRFTDPDRGRFAVAFQSEALDLSFHDRNERKTVTFQPSTTQSSIPKT
jgi:hypothetical protein